MMVNEYFYDQEMPSGYFGQSSAQQLIRDPKLFTMGVAQQQPAAKKPEEKPAAKPVVMRVDICCHSCVEAIDYDIKKVKGVKGVECDVYREKVTVTGPASVADILSAARKHFKKAELWE